MSPVSALFLLAIFVGSHGQDDGVTVNDQFYGNFYQYPGLFDVPDDKIGVTFYFSSRQLRGPKPIVVNSPTQLQNTDFDAERCSVFIVHGWEGNFKDKENTEIRDAVLAIRDCNVFSVDWSSTAQALLAAQAAPKVGGMLGKYIRSVFNTDLNEVRLYGFGLGAHVCGFAGRSLDGQIPVIVGLDPARDIFGYDSKSRLDTADAKFVQVIHTSIIWGIIRPIGHADYYPNGGILQPNCQLNPLCCHHRSHELFAESIESGEFLAVQCSNYGSYKLGFCSENDASYMGTLDVDTSARGMYFLDTARRPPYALD